MSSVPSVCGTIHEVLVLGRAGTVIMRVIFSCCLWLLLAGLTLVPHCVLSCALTATYYIACTWNFEFVGCCCTMLSTLIVKIPIRKKNDCHCCPPLFTSSAPNTLINITEVMIYIHPILYYPFNITNVHTHTKCASCHKYPNSRLLTLEFIQYSGFVELGSYGRKHLYSLKCNLSSASFPHHPFSELLDSFTDHSKAIYKDKCLLDPLRVRCRLSAWIGLSRYLKLMVLCRVGLRHIL